ncbi:hypothetical protein ACA910_002026 [Epithemia clementina (nom. ined.)]
MSPGWSFTSTRPFTALPIAQSNPKNQNHHGHRNDSNAVDNTISWTELLKARGSNLWSYRANALQPPQHHSRDERLEEGKRDERNSTQESWENNQDDNHECKDHGIVHLRVGSSQRRQRPCRQRKDLNTVRVYTTIHDFVRDEKQFGLDKINLQSLVKPKALTQAVGDEWIRQRRVVRDPIHGPLRSIKEQSLRAAARVRVFENLRQEYHHHKQEESIRGQQQRQRRWWPWTKSKASLSSSSSVVVTVLLKVDLKELVMQAVVKWVVLLFDGTDNDKVEDCFMTYWTKLRQRVSPGATELAQARNDLIEAIQHEWNRNNNDMNSNDKKDGDGDADGSFHDGDSCGLFQMFRDSKMSSVQGEAMENILHAMIAASDAANCLVFWTLWNLVNNDHHPNCDSPQHTTLWELCQAEVRNETGSSNENKNYNESNRCWWPGSPIVNTDLEQLALLKQKATQGEAVNQALFGLSHLGCALVETLRVFPPVWTLPRAWNRDHDTRDSNQPDDDTNHVVISAKLDVPTANNVRDYRDWNPHKLVSVANTTGTRTSCHSAPFQAKDMPTANALKEQDTRDNSSTRQPTQDDDTNDTSSGSYDIRIASFGVGKRSCAAGTAALWAARVLLHQAMQTMATLEECQPGRALQCTYLGPTLATDGPQWFYVTCGDDVQPKGL